MFESDNDLIASKSSSDGETNLDSLFMNPCSIFIGDANKFLSLTTQL